MNPYRCYFIIIFRHFGHVLVAMFLWKSFVFFFFWWKSFVTTTTTTPKKKKVWPIKKHLIYFLTMILELLWFLIYCPNKSKSNYFLMASSRWLANILNLIIGMSLELGTYQTHTGVVIETQKGMSGILMNRSKTLLKF